MKVITITESGRWQYLERLLDDLALNDLREWHLRIQCEPIATQSHSYATGKIRNGPLGKMLASYSVQINDQTLGVKDNPFDLLSSVFGPSYIADYVLYLESDLTISADTTKLADWYIENRNGGEWGWMDGVHPALRPGCEDIGLRLFHPIGGADMNPELLIPVERFSSLGLVFDRSQWQRHFKPNWNNGTRGWDWAMQDYLDAADGERVLICPVASRSNHTGREGGVHCPAELHDNRYGHIDAYRGPPIDDWRLVSATEKLEH